MTKNLTIDRMRESLEARLMAEDIEDLEMINHLQSEITLAENVEQYIRIEVDKPRSKLFDRGRQRFFTHFLNEETLASTVQNQVIQSGLKKSRSRRKDKTPELIDELIGVMTFHTYEVKPGETCTLNIRFIANGEYSQPTGTLIIETTRGILSKQRVELDGKQDKVTVEYTAPNETIKVSIRAYLDDFTRGKIRLQLIA